MKNLVIADSNSPFQSILEARFSENRVNLPLVGKMLKDKNSSRMFELFQSLDDGDNVVIDTKFTGLNEFELFLSILLRFPKPEVTLNVYILNNDLSDLFEQYMEMDKTEKMQLYYLQVRRKHNFYQCGADMVDVQIKLKDSEKQETSSRAIQNCGVRPRQEQVQKVRSFWNKVGRPSYYGSQLNAERRLRGGERCLAL